jgi:hypothetical protein
MKTMALLTVGSMLLAVATTASAQEVNAQAQAQVAAPTVAAPRPVVTDESPDHDRFVGHFAIGYFGISQLPVATGFNGGNGGAGGVVAGTVNAPIIGGRYWLNRGLGIDAGLGFGMTGGSSEVVVNANNQTTTTDTDHTSFFGFALHGGVPLAFAYGHHYTFELVPEATLGIASGTIKGTTVANTTTPDTSLSGFRLDLGAHVGAEIHFGFIGVPELALQASVGLYVRRQSVKAKQDNNSASDGTTTISTSVGSDPWALFVNNISALYYF